MKYMGAITMILGICCIDSSGIWMYIAGAAVLAGCALMYAGWRWERERQIKKARLAENRDRTFANYILADCRSNHS